MSEEQVDRPFVALVTFETTIGKIPSRYKAGQVYTLRAGNEVLATLTGAWVVEGKIVFYDDPAFRKKMAAHNLEIREDAVRATVKGRASTRPGARR